jgi:ankyrin repeat protein
MKRRFYMGRLRAASSGHETVVWLLLGHKVDVNAKDKYGATALHRTTENGHEVVVPLLQSKHSQSKTISPSNKSRSAIRNH